MAITANVNSSTAFAPWDFTRLANCAVTPICAISTKDRGARDPGAPRPMTARSIGTTCHALNGYRAKTTTWCSTIKSSTTSIFGATCVVVLVVDTHTQRRAVLFSTDTDLDTQTLYRGYKARFQIEFLFRDAKQFTSLSACQARSQAKLHFHFNASMSALTLGKLEALQQSGNAQAGFSMASLKRRAFNQHLLERISQHLAQGHSLEKSSPDYQELCNYGTISEMAA